MRRGRTLCPLIAEVAQLQLVHQCPIPACRNEMAVAGRPCRRDRELFGPYLREVTA